MKGGILEYIEGHNTDSYELNMQLPLSSFWGMIIFIKIIDYVLILKIMQMFLLMYSKSCLSVLFTVGCKLLQNRLLM